jgi:lycopene beta-cyclase
VDVDVAIVGAGAAGLSLVVHLDALLLREPSARPPSVVLLDPAAGPGAARTWCFWGTSAGPAAPAVHRSWRHVEVIDPAGGRRVLELDPLRYFMIRSVDFHALGAQAAERLGGTRVTAAVDEVRDGEERAEVRARGTTVRARWVFDSRPIAPPRPGSTTLLQHFRGWTVRFPHDVLAPDLPTLMDFSTPQPARGVSFGYCLPLDGARGLVEYTECTPARLPDPAYDDALRGYLSARWGRAGAAARVEAVEDGAIPMTDSVFPRRVGRRVFRIGTAGGATRGSSGYTFAAMQRQAAAMAAALLAGREPVPPAPYPRRHRWMDAVLLRVLDRGMTDPAWLLARLFDRNPPIRVLRFLDGQTGPAEELALMAGTPTATMLRAAAADAAARLRRASARRGGQSRWSTNRSARPM